MFRIRLSSFLLLFAMASLSAAESGGTGSAFTGRLNSASLKKAAYAPPGATSPAPDIARFSNDTLVFSAPPRESAVEGESIYAPVAEFLGKTIGRKVVYKHPGTWGVYRSEMLKGSYDIVFDGPHFNAYRAEKLGHNILVKAPELHEFAVIVRKEERFNALSQMAGRTFCTHAPPNLGTLVLLNQFGNPSRQPVITNTEGWDKIYAGVTSGRCAAGVMPVAILKRLDKNARMKVVFKSAPMQNQAFSAGPRLTPEQQARLAAALVSPVAASYTEQLRSSFKVGPQFVATSNQEYAGLSHYLRNEWGYF